MTATLSLKTQRKLRQTAAGGAKAVRTIMEAKPQLADIQLDFYLMANRLNEVLFLKDPDAMSVGAWEMRAKQLTDEMETLTQRMKAVCARG